MATNGNGTRATGPRCVALVGPFQSGKTTLLEAILTRTGAIPRQGSIEGGNGDHAWGHYPEHTPLCGWLQERGFLDPANPR